MSDALVNRMLVRAIDAIQTLGAGHQHGHHDRCVQLRAWHLESDIDLSAAITSGPDSPADKGNSAQFWTHMDDALKQDAQATRRQRIYLALCHGGELRGIDMPLLSKLISGVQATPSDVVIINAAQADLEAVCQAASDLRGNRIDDAVVVSCSQQQNLLAGVVMSAVAMGGSGGLRLDLSVPESAPAGEYNDNNIELTVALDNDAGYRPLLHPAARQDMPSVLLSIILMARSLSADRGENDDDQTRLLQWLSVKPLQQHPGAGLVLMVRHTVLSADIRLISADSNQVNDQDQAPGHVSPGSDRSRALNQALEMLADVSGYALLYGENTDDDSSVIVLDSLMAARFTSRFQAAFGKQIPPALLLDQPTAAQLIKRLSTWLEKAAQADVYQPRHERKTAVQVL